MFECDKIFNNKKSRRYINDLILLAAIILFSFFIKVVINSFHSDVSTICISTINHEHLKDVIRIPINNNGYYVVYTEANKLFVSTCFEDLDEACSSYKSVNNINILEVRDGFADVVEADCPDRICVNTKKINVSGESIICLPHKLVVSMESESIDAGDIDAVTW